MKCSKCGRLIAEVEREEAELKQSGDVKKIMNYLDSLREEILLSLRGGITR